MVSSIHHTSRWGLCMWSTLYTATVVDNLTIFIGHKKCSVVMLNVLKNMHEIYFWYLIQTLWRLDQESGLSLTSVCKATYILKLIWILSLLCANCMNLGQETCYDNVSSLKAMLKIWKKIARHRVTRLLGYLFVLLNLTFKIVCGSNF